LGERAGILTPDYLGCGLHPALVPYRLFSCFLCKKITCKALIPLIGVWHFPGIKPDSYVSYKEKGWVERSEEGEPDTVYSFTIHHVPLTAYDVLITH
jgi:hypothetical protein